jgi:hypothetical protein
LEQVDIQQKHDRYEAPKSWTATVSDAASSLSHSIRDALQNPIVDAAVLASIVLVASKCRAFAPFEQLLPDFKLVAEKGFASEGVAIAESAIEGSGVASAVKSIDRSRAILSATETKASLQAANPGVNIDAMEYPKPNFSPFARRLTELPRTTETVYTKKSFPDGALQEYNSGGNIGIYDLHSKLKIEQSPANLYLLKNGTELVVPKEFDAQLAEVRALRLAGAKPNSLRSLFNLESIRLVRPDSVELDRLEAFVSANEKPHQTVGELIKDSGWSTEEISRALGRTSVPAELSTCKVSALSEEIVRLRTITSLRGNSLKSALMPEDVPLLLRTLPDASMVKRITLLNESSEPYFVEKFVSRPIDLIDSSPIKLTFGAAAKTSDGNITFFRSAGLYADRVVTTAKHEQVHLNHSPAYKVARRLDPRLEASHYGYTNARESEAELEATAFLSGSVPRFFAAVDKAPLRMSVLANKLTKTISAAPEGGRPIDTKQILARAHYIQDNVIPKQSERIAGLISTSTPKQQADLNLLLEALRP